jgi:transposase
MAGRPMKYPPEFKADAIAMVRASPDVSVKEIAARLGVNYWTLGTWYRADEMARKHGNHKKVPKGPAARSTADPEAREESAEERATRLERENAVLRKKVEQLEMDRAILKKAAAFFAKESE